MGRIFWISFFFLFSYFLYLSFAQCWSVGFVRLERGVGCHNAITHDAPRSRPCAFSWRPLEGMGAVSGVDNGHPGYWGNKSKPQPHNSDWPADSGGWGTRRSEKASEWTIGQVRASQRSKPLRRTYFSGCGGVKESQWMGGYDVGAATRRGGKSGRGRGRGEIERRITCPYLSVGPLDGWLKWLAGWVMEFRLPRKVGVHVGERESERSGSALFFDGVRLLRFGA
jgi:hypothetical protein